MPARKRRVEQMSEPGKRKIMRTRTTLSVLIAVILVSFALSPMARAECRDGCDPIYVLSTFLGDDALVNNTTGFWNTAIGGDALMKNTTGSQNTAVGMDALSENTEGSSNVAIGNHSLS